MVFISIFYFYIKVACLLSIRLFEVHTDDKLRYNCNILQLLNNLIKPRLSFYRVLIRGSLANLLFMNAKNIPHSPDTLFSKEKNVIKKFSFNQQVVDVFPDMINRSVPGYAQILDGIGKIAEECCPSSALIYDLGCSLGGASLSIAKHLSSKNPRIRGVDNSDAMISRCQQHIQAYSYGACIELFEGDLIDFELEECDMVVVNFTLQFVEPSMRQHVLNKICRHLKPGGILVLSEKIKHLDQNIDEILIGLHHSFKRENGYSDLEISQKRNALEDVMKIDTLQMHQERLLDAGFKASSVWFQQLNFLSIIAVK